VEPRVVVVRRTTEYESLLVEHGTVQMARFRLELMGQSMDKVERMHAVTLKVAAHALRDVPHTWRKTSCLRSDLDRFVFQPGDIIVAVGQDGLVPNVAKYLDGQTVAGINPDTSYKAKMMVWREREIPLLYGYLKNNTAKLQRRSMVEVEIKDDETQEEGRKIIALNELFCGHHSHQSAKYDIAYEQHTEYQSSSGMIISSGTGCTGWASSVASQRRNPLPFPEPEEGVLIFQVREAWDSPFSGVSIQQGYVEPDAPLKVTSRMQEGGVIFGDGIESDRLEFAWGQTATFKVSGKTLNLMVRTGTRGR